MPVKLSAGPGTEPIFCPRKQGGRRAGACCPCTNNIWKEGGCLGRWLRCEATPAVLASGAAGGTERVGAPEVVTLWANHRKRWDAKLRDYGAERRAMSAGSQSANRWKQRDAKLRDYGVNSRACARDFHAMFAGLHSKLSETAGRKAWGLMCPSLREGATL